MTCERKDGVRYSNLMAGWQDSSEFGRSFCRKLMSLMADRREIDTVRYRDVCLSRITETICGMGLSTPRARPTPSTFQLHELTRFCIVIDMAGRRPQGVVSQ